MKQHSLSLYNEIKTLETLLYDVLSYGYVRQDLDNPQTLHVSFGNTITLSFEDLSHKSYMMFVEDSLEVFDVRISTNSYITKNQTLGCDLQISLFDDVNALILEWHIFLADDSSLTFVVDDGIKPFEIEVIPGKKT